MLIQGESTLFVHELILHLEITEACIVEDT
jgi:hypothetical protein